MANESDTPPAVPDDCEGPRLENLFQVRKALAQAARLIKAGKLPSERAGNYVNALTSLAKVMQDARDSLWLPRVKELWRDKQEKQPEAPH